MTRIQEAIKQLLAELRIRKPPIPVERVAEARGVRVKRAALDGDISGFLFRKKGKAIIAINAMHPLVRQRFTLAHELGHVALNHQGDFFLDRKVILFRDANSGKGTDRHEIEANRFAAELLMPEAMIRKELKNNPVDMDDQESLEELAAKFAVSTQALTIRLKDLDLLTL
jgi:Zn-dependent peptidase ImmA (M78 family)